MAIDIKVSGGVDFNAYLADFAANFEAAGRGAFSDGLSGDEYALWSGEGSAPPIADGQAFIIGSGDAGDLAYDFLTHTVGGTIDSLDFGTGVTDLGGGDFDTDSDLLLSGLDLESVGGDGIVNKLVLDLMGGNTDVLLSLLKSADLNFEGSGKADAFKGFKGDDVIDGGKGADVLNGGKGSDELIGGKGADVLTGGKGADTFTFDAKQGHDVITDFGNGKDVISFVGGQFDDFQDMLDSASVNGDGDVVIELGSKHSITLEGVGLEDLHQGDFLFA
ncbi:calcium-binding protein [Chenggangzhangella methanolivorans]|uniref:Hemolysin type calcium-binding protein n=1 Tax=Chenggangzhangella methanolivorans TaxID=1437009 RepID=A0A9E6RBR3_9HYPH|nr:heme acquisition protein HasA [Chenggangzhangella methanolivorans]QZO01874.1 hypothetical protein K6K41_11320 [Chenggangzhangella methanolivorans]